ncbi:MAG: GDP-mannose 4,6-dehydratase [Chloroflexota bacterium]|nr:GDP-mannose 4,6-dehydratase [Chloroflexota bacterium]
MPKTCLVTGAAGFIGSHLVARLLLDGHSVTGIDDMSSGKLDRLPSDFDLRQMDMRDPDLRCVMSEINPDLVFHLAAQISVTASTRQPEFDAEVNIGGALNILEGIRAIKDKDMKFVYITSGGTVYGDPQVIPVDESAALKPLSPYGASKLAVETYLPIYEKLCGLNYTILRLANVYGPTQDPHGEAGVVAIFTQAILEGRSPNIFGDGNDERDYVFVSDVIEAIILASESERTGPFNIGTGIGTSTNKIFEILASHCGFTNTPIHGPRRPGDIARISLDVNKAFDEIAWKPKTRLEDGLRTTVEWFESEFEVR